MHILHPIPAFADNYIWALHDGSSALVVDPGEARPVLDWLQEQQVQLVGILVTHHHADHTGGVAELMGNTAAPAWGPDDEPMPSGVRGTCGGATLSLLDLSFDVIAVPGHTAGHLAFFCHNAAGAPLLFCGDTLFSAGCGRLFEGTPGQMLAALDRLASLPAATRVCCAHEYTLANLRFARTVEPDNPDLAQYLDSCASARAAGRPTLPSTMALELRVNPFLRSRAPSVRKALGLRGACMVTEVDAFAALRRWKDEFR